MAIARQDYRMMSMQAAYPNVYQAFLKALDKVNVGPYDVIAELVGINSDMTLIRIRCGTDFQESLEWSISTSHLLCLHESVMQKFEQVALACRQATMDGYKAMMKNMQP